MPVLNPAPTVVYGDDVGLYSLLDRLAGIDHLTERAFLQIGERVRGGHRALADLASEAEEVLQSAGGEAVGQMMSRLLLLTERGAQWLAEARSQAEAICATLVALDRERTVLSAPRAGLGKVVKTLQALRLATRIEAARKDGHGALVLGDELHHLGNLLQEKLAHVEERCEMLASLLQRALALETQARDGYLREAAGELGQTRVLLEKVSARFAGSAEQAGQFHRSTLALADNFGELVAALQFQDITRQRLKHIRETLRDLADGWQTHSDAAATTFGRSCQLQHDQLHDAVGEFCAAIDRLEQNLHGMAEGVHALASDIRAALVTGGNRQWALIVPSLQGVMTALEMVQTAHLAAGQAVFAVCQVVRDVVELTGEIGLLGEEMQLLAQNAAISAAHGSKRAVGLTVIAGNIQDLAEEAGGYAIAMGDCCRQVSSRSDGLHLGDRQDNGREIELDELLNEARRLIELLESENRDLDARITAIGRVASELGDGLQEGMQGAILRQAVLDELEPVMVQLRLIAVAHGGGVSAGQRDGRALTRSWSRYTMKSERDVHRQFAGEHTPEAGKIDELPADQAGAFLGSNVELF